MLGLGTWINEPDKVVEILQTELGVLSKQSATQQTGALLFDVAMLMEKTMKVLYFSFAKIGRLTLKKAKNIRPVGMAKQEGGRMPSEGHLCKKNGVRQSPREIPKTHPVSKSRFVGFAQMVEVRSARVVGNVRDGAGE